MKRKYLFWFALIFSLVIVYGLFDPDLYAFPKCPFRSLTGWMCPGCGSQRAVHQLLHGHLFASFSLNPLLMPALLYALTGYAIAFFFPEKWDQVRLKWFGHTAGIIALIIIFTFWMARNLM